MSGHESHTGTSNRQKSHEQGQDQGEARSREKVIASSRQSLSPDSQRLLDEALSSAAARYIRGCDSRVERFVREHYSLRGSLRLHRHALGWDILRVPLNVLWTLIRLVLAILGLIVASFGINTIRSWVERLPQCLETQMQRRINHLLITELLALPNSYAGEQQNSDALLDELLKEPAVLDLLASAEDGDQQAAMRPSQRMELETKLSEYGASRTGTAELASNAAILISSKAALGKASFGALGAGAAVSGAIAHSMAVSNFWLGSTLGAYYYAVFPAKASLQLQVAVTSSLGLVLALVSTFIGIVTDPIQAKLGLHQRRLRRLIAAIDQDLQGHSGKGFSLREKYVGKLFDIADVISTAGRIL